MMGKIYWKMVQNISYGIGRTGKNETDYVWISLVPMNRPYSGGKKAIRTIRLVVNHLPVKFVPDLKIYHYNFDIQRVNNGSRKREKYKLREK